MKLSQARLVALVLFVLVSMSGCTVINRIRAKNELNEAARAYKDGRYFEAEQHSKRALELDPLQKTAPTFIARSIHAQYRPGVESQENKSKATEAIEAYKKILEKHPEDEESYKSIAALLGALDKNKQREWIMKRASDPNVPKEKRAEAYTILANIDWQCSLKITEQEDVKKTEQKDGKLTIVYQKPKLEVFEAAKQCVARGLEEAEKAISDDPNNENASAYKTNLLMEAAKLAEMDGNMDKKAEFTKLAEEALNRTTELSGKRQKREEEEQKKEGAAPKPPAS